MTTMKKLFLSLMLLPLFLTFFSCTAGIEGEFKEGGEVNLTLKTALGPRMIALIRSLRGFMGEDGNEPILDGLAISQSIAASPGARAVRLVNTGPSALDGIISISKVDDFLSAGASKTRFISYTEGREAGTSSVVILIDRNSAPEIISRLSSEVEEYLSALMAPVVLGETSTRREYLQLITSVYGRPLADEIAAARLKASIEFPRPVKTAAGGNIVGRKVEFDVPIVDILVLEKPLRYELSW